MSSVLASLTLRAQLAGCLLRGARARPPAPRCRRAPAARPRSRPAASCASTSASCVRLLASATPAMLGLGLARLPLHGGQHARASAQARPGIRATAGAGAAPRPAPRAGARPPARLRARAVSAALALHLLLAGQQPEPAALLQPAGGGDGALRGGDEPVPAPQVALDGDQALAGLRAAAAGARRRRAARRRSGSGGAPAPRGAGDMRGQRLDALRAAPDRARRPAFSANARAPRQRRAHRGRRPARRPAPARSPTPP